jgi:hypothetical protein
MADVKWYAIYEKATGRLHTTASIDLDDPDTAVDPVTQRPYSLSGMRGIAHPDEITTQDFEAIELAFSPQAEPLGMQGGRYEWDETRREFVARDGRELKVQELTNLEQRVTELKAELAKP